MLTGPLGAWQSRKTPLFNHLYLCSLQNSAKHISEDNHVLR